MMDMQAIDLPQMGFDSFARPAYSHATSSGNISFRSGAMAGRLYVVTQMGEKSFQVVGENTVLPWSGHLNELLPFTHMEAEERIELMPWLNLFRTYIGFAADDGVTWLIDNGE